MVEIDSKLTAERKRIIRKKKQRYKYFIRFFLWFCVTFALLVISGFQQQISQALDVSVNIIGSAFSIGLLLTLLAIVYLFFDLMLRRQLELPYEDLLFLDVYNILDNIEAYIAEPDEAYRRKAENSLDRLMYEIDSWDAGQLKVCQNEMNPHIEPFKETFYRKVIGASRQIEKSDWEKAFINLTEFAKFLVNTTPKISELDSITLSMNKDISITLPAKTQNKVTLKKLVKIPLFKHFIAISVFVLIGFTLGYGGYYGLHVPIEYDFTMAITVPLALIGIYIDYLRKRP